ncbi:hypothetical protein F5Y15DRAFT_406570 [Xylariaceae sp. FL0016]|nr:hypothetical protein F5Y15DRAFT_406570 [Xylariaceae sp. FL0016]
MSESAYSVEVSSPEPMHERIVRVTQDLRSLTAFYSIESSATRHARLNEFYAAELKDLATTAPFFSYAQDEKADYLLLKNYLRRAQRTLKLDRERDEAFAPFVAPFAGPITAWCERRQRVEMLDPKTIADSFTDIAREVARSQEHVVQNAGKYSKATGFRAARTVAALRGHLKEMIEFYKGYDPMFDWWVEKPYKALDAALARAVDHIRDVLVGVKPGDEDTIVGEPIGREGLLTELEAEMIPYTPEELIQIAETEYAWCEREMKQASTELGFGPHDWRAALEHVKNLYEPPASQPTFVQNLVDEAASYVQRHDLVTVPRVAAEAIRMTRIPPAQQRVSPFFLGGRRLQLSYPTGTMPHDAKRMALRGNNRHFCKATAFHEMVPGHHLQLFIGDRARPYRGKLFTTPFFVEGWALYWEMVFWGRGDFFAGPEDRVGALFWRMHRCARIVFSLKFHLGQMTAPACVDLLVDWVGHERATAEGEVRRSFNGDYAPLYQAGYMLGALQLMKLREEAVGKGPGMMREKEFHDKVLRANTMPIEMLRALLLGKDLSEDFKSEWRFYGGTMGCTIIHSPS